MSQIKLRKFLFQKPKSTFFIANFFLKHTSILLSFNSDDESILQHHRIQFTIGNLFKTFHKIFTIFLINKNENSVEGLDKVKNKNERIE